MKPWRRFDKERLTIFTDAIMAIIMTILVLDLKVPVLAPETDESLKAALLEQAPHFFGFVISFSIIILLWFSHHNFMKTLQEADSTIALLNFLFVGSIATLPYSTALVSEYPEHSLAVFVLATNFFLMNLFLTGMFIYVNKKNLVIPDVFPERYSRIKRTMGLAGLVIFGFSMIVSWFSPMIALILIIIVPLMHCIPLPGKTAD